MQIPAGQTLWDDEIDLSPDGPLSTLWWLIRQSGWRDHTGGMGRTKTSKLLAAKRPHAVPIYDSLVASTLYEGKPKDYWQLWRERLTDERGVAFVA